MFSPVLCLILCGAAALLSGAAAQDHVIAPLCSHETTHTRQAPSPGAVQNPDLCIVQSDPAAANGNSSAGGTYFVTALGYGTVASDATRTMRAWMVAESPTRACAASGATLYVWMQLSHNTFAPVEIDMTTLEPRKFHTSVTLPPHTDVGSLLAAAYHPQRHSLL